MISKRSNLSLSSRIPNQYVPDRNGWRAFPFIHWVYISVGVWSFEQWDIAGFRLVRMRGLGGGLQVPGELQGRLQDPRRPGAHPQRRRGTRGALLSGFCENRARAQVLKAACEVKLAWWCGLVSGVYLIWGDLVHSSLVLTATKGVQFVFTPVWGCFALHSAEPLGESHVSRTRMCAREALARTLKGVVLQSKQLGACQEEETARRPQNQLGVPSVPSTSHEKPAPNAATCSRTC